MAYFLTYLLTCNTIMKLLLLMRVVSAERKAPQESLGSASPACSVSSRLDLEMPLCTVLTLLTLTPNYHTARQPTPPQRHRAKAILLREEKAVFTLLEELDRETAAAAELRKARLEVEAVTPVATSTSSRVSLFGARLDDDVAGQEFKGTMAIEEYEKLFEAGVALMKRGEYKKAVTAFTRATACAPGGLTGRKGGQYAIYLAQALDAANRKKEAVGLLQRCEAHPDADVRKVADSVLYIMRAPELKLGEENFIKITPMEPTDDWSRRRGPQQQKDPPPEKYSIEWYVLEAEKRKRDKERSQSGRADVAPALLASGAILLSSAGLLLMRQGS